MTPTTPTFNILLMVSASVPRPGQDEPDSFPVYEYAGHAEDTGLLLCDLNALGSAENLENVRDAVVRFYVEDLETAVPTDVTRTLRFEMGDQKGSYVAFAPHCGCPVALWEDELAPSMQARLFQEHIQKGLIIQHVPGRFVPSLEARNLECPHGNGNPGLFDQPIENCTSSLAAVRIDPNGLSIQANQMGLLALIDALQRALVGAPYELHTFNDAAEPVVLTISHETL